MATATLWSYYTDGTFLISSGCATSVRGGVGWRDGSLRSVKIGSCRRIPADALRDFIASLPPEVAA